MIDVLVDRLRWPAALVRERAASQLGKLIAEGDEAARNTLLSWMNRQELESVAAIGLLPFLYAARESARPFTENELSSACRASSALSELYLCHFDPVHKSSAWLSRHSGPRPSGWNPPNKVTPASHRALDFLLDRLRVVEEVYLKPLTAHFEFEVSVLEGRYGQSPAQAFRAAGTQDRGYHPFWQPLSREVRLSAYLRTLAWAASRSMLPDDVILDRASSISPVDLGLWHVAPSNSPRWWPSLSISSHGEVDREIVEIIQNVESTVEAWGTGTYVVLAASGCISQTGLIQHNLEVRSFFQQPDGPERPTSQELFEELHSIQGSVRQETSPLRFEGAVTVDRDFQQLSDWLIFPCSGSTLPKAIISWQSWRGMRKLQCPSHLLSEGEIQAVCRGDSIDYEDEEGLIARWSDWSEGVSAIAVRDLMPNSGWVLVAPRGVVERFSEATGMNLAWAWEIASNFRQYSYEEFTEHRIHDDRGTSRVVRP